MSICEYAFKSNTRSSHIGARTHLDLVKGVQQRERVFAA